MPHSEENRPHRRDVLLTEPAQIKQLAAELAESPMVAIDTEFIRENTFFPSVELLQVANRKKAWLIDVQRFRGKDLAGLEPLLDIFRNPKILKILHAAQGDQECLYTSFEVVAKPSFDTAVGASLCGMGDGIGLGNLLKAVLNINLKKGHARTNWAQRPLPDQLIEYALGDVDHLVEAAEVLFAKLDKLKRREWSLELSAKWEDEKLYQPDPEGLAMKLAKGGRLDAKAFAALKELVKWREDRVRQLNLPRRWVADDQVLIDLANVRPKDLDHLSTFRGLNRGEIKASGEKILASLKAASQSVGPEIPRSSRMEAPTTAESQVLDLIKTYVGILADREKIAVKHLVTAQQLLPLLRQKLKSPADLVAAGMLSSSAAELIGGEILALLQGRRALSVMDGAVKIVSLE